MWLFFLIVFLIPSSSLALEKTTSVKISASIGENEITLYGYTSPDSKVELNGNNVYDVTYSDQTGFFEFQKTLLPKTYIASELCITSIDENYRTTHPVCIPPPPSSNYHTDIGPILLPPTLTIENDNIKPGSTVITSGQSIPNSQVDVHFFKIDNTGKTFPKSVHAYSLPSLSVKTDSLGYFSLNLPTAQSSDYRLFANVIYNDYNSAKSNTLIFKLPSLFSLFYQQNSYLFWQLPLYVITITLFFYLVYGNLLFKSKKYLPAIKPNYTPALYPESLKRTNNIPE